MKPLKLKIKGLNSFVEEQVIDFEKLTRQGFFGIFGPTGSGKSTILDGMILALYGMKAMSRGTTEFVNKTCKTAQVSYAFQITGKEIKRYRVEREFKALEKGTKSGKCKLLDITDGEIVLEETVSGVDRACAAIIGLTADDFMRTVVLPQGKFSEFLKVSGKDRREILERLFRLEEYGIRLEERISGALRKEQEERTLLAGQAEAYGGYTKELLEEQEACSVQTEETLKEAEQILQGKREKLEEAETVWELQREEVQRAQAFHRLLEEQDAIEILKRTIEEAERAKHVLPFLRSVKVFEQKETELEQKIQQTTDSYMKWKAVLDKSKTEFAELELRKENEEGTLIANISHAREAMEYWEELPALQKLEKETKNRRETAFGAEKELEKQEQELEEALEKQKRFLEEFLSGSLEELLILRLRERQKEGEPCPVCGSVHHTISAVGNKTEERQRMDMDWEMLEQTYRKKKAEQAVTEKKQKEIQDKRVKQKEYVAELDLKLAPIREKIAQKQEQIIKKTGVQENPGQYLKRLEESLRKLQQDYKEKKVQKEQAQIQITECEEQKNSLQGERKGNLEALKREETLLMAEMERQQFASKEAVEEAVLEEKVYETYVKKTEDFARKLQEAELRLKETQKKRNQRSVSEEYYQNCKKEVDALDAQIIKLRETITEIRQTIRQIRENLEKQAEVAEQMQKVEHKIAVLEDLKSVTRGKRFVEFMAMERLRYISKSASRRLYEITNGSYELEINGEGEFIIRDNKNGGVLRQTATLSGGETFVTSLALALALSSEIQLKGTAPLELFFLDEGFGSLDETLLDVVMESLEKIHNEQLKVGIISHVESVKTRVPMRLVVSPAKAGICGSKVTVECL